MMPTKEISSPTELLQVLIQIYIYVVLLCMLVHSAVCVSTASPSLTPSSVASDSSISHVLALCCDRHIWSISCTHWGNLVCIGRRGFLLVCVWCGVVYMLF